MSARDVIRDFLQGSDLSCDDAITALTAAGYRILGPDELDPVTQQAETLLREFLSCEYESKRDLNDCIDNHGKPYQSQYLYDLIAKAEAFLSRPLFPEAPQPEAKEARDGR